MGELRTYVEKLCFRPMKPTDKYGGFMTKAKDGAFWIVMNCAGDGCSYYNEVTHMCTASRQQRKRRNSDAHRRCYPFAIPVSQCFNAELKQTVPGEDKEWFLKYQMMAGVHTSLTWGKKDEAKNRMFPYKTPHMGHIIDLWAEVKGRSLTYAEKYKLRYGRDAPQDLVNKYSKPTTKRSSIGRSI